MYSRHILTISLALLLTFAEAAFLCRKWGAGKDTGQKVQQEEEAEFKSETCCFVRIQNDKVDVGGACSKHQKCSTNDDNNDQYNCGKDEDGGLFCCCKKDDCNIKKPAAKEDALCASAVLPALVGALITGVVTIVIYGIVWYCISSDDKNIGLRAAGRHGNTVSQTGLSVLPSGVTTVGGSNYSKSRT